MKLNTVTLEGNLTREPELHETTGGTLILSGTVGHNRPIKDKATGGWATEAHFFDFRAFNRVADWNRDLQKGDPLIITGRLQQDTWEDKTTGQKRQRVVIVADEIRPLQRRTAPQQTAASPATPPPVPDEDVPF